jgi:AcrR family transcriptional regulator
MPKLQEERSADTRRRLLDATLACLSERGYAGTTTTEIANRAGVSRGAQLHHFPRKLELVATAVRHLFELRLSELRTVVGKLPQPIDARLDSLIDLMWPVFKGPTFYAWLELVVASRTDPKLRELVHSISRWFGGGIQVVFRELFPSIPAADVASMVRLVFGRLEALALERTFRVSEDAPDPDDFEQDLATLKAAANACLHANHGSAASTIQTPTVQIRGADQ